MLLGLTRKKKIHSDITTEITDCSLWQNKDQEQFFKYDVFLFFSKKCYAVSLVYVGYHNNIKDLCNSNQIQDAHEYIMF